MKKNEKLLNKEKYSIFDNDKNINLKVDKNLYNYIYLKVEKRVLKQKKNMLIANLVINTLIIPPYLIISTVLKLDIKVIIASIFINDIIIVILKQNVQKEYNLITEELEEINEDEEKYIKDKGYKTIEKELLMKHYNDLRKTLLNVNFVSIILLINIINKIIYDIKNNNIVIDEVTISCLYTTFNLLKFADDYKYYSKYLKLHL